MNKLRSDQDVRAWVDWVLEPVERTVSSPARIPLSVDFYPGDSNGEGSWALVAHGWVRIARFPTERQAKAAMDAIVYAMTEAA